MTPPKAASPASSLPEELRPLATELAKLPRDEREMVISAARAANTTKQGYPTISWASLMSARGIVSFGGNAVDIAEGQAPPPRKRDPKAIIGALSDMADVLEEVTEAAMVSRERDPLRLPNG